VTALENFVVGHLAMILAVVWIGLLILWGYTDNLEKRVTELEAKVETLEDNWSRRWEL
jgi:hypothetical protein